MWWPRNLGAESNVGVLDPAVLADHSHRGLAAKRGIGQDHVDLVAWFFEQGVLDPDRRVGLRVGRADVVQEEVHGAQASGVVNDLCP